MWYWDIQLILSFSSISTIVFCSRRGIREKKHQLFTIALQVVNFFWHIFLQKWPWLSFFLWYFGHYFVLKWFFFWLKTWSFCSYRSTKNKLQLSFPWQTLFCAVALEKMFVMHWRTCYVSWRFVPWSVRKLAWFYNNNKK